MVGRYPAPRVRTVGRGVNTVTVRCAGRGRGREATYPSNDQRHSRSRHTNWARGMNGDELLEVL